MPIVDAFLTNSFEWWDLTKKDVHDLNLLGKEVEGDSGTVVIAEPNSFYYHGWVEDASVSQYGVCSDCETEMASWAKRAICPNCESETYLT